MANAVAVPFRKAPVNLKVRRQLLHEFRYCDARFAEAAELLRRVPYAAAAQELLISALHIGGEKRRLAPAVGKAEELPGLFLPEDPLLGFCARENAALLRRHRGDLRHLLLGELFEKLCSQNAGSRLASDVKPAQLAKAAGGAPGALRFLRADLPHVYIGGSVVSAGRSIAQIGLRCNCAAYGAEHKVLLPVIRVLVIELIVVGKKFAVL